MKSLVIDVSATLGFLLKDELDPLSLSALEQIRANTLTYVPIHWSMEVANALLMTERRKRISQLETAEILLNLQNLSLIVDDEPKLHSMGDTFALARQFQLTIYDAAYLELAIRRQATLATNDRELLKAAKATGVAVL